MAQRTDLRILKESIDIVDIIGRYITLTKKGAEYKGICPFHDDSDASLNVNQKKQLWFCPVCDGDKKGDVFDFLRCMGKSLPEAVQIIQGDVEFTLPEEIAKTAKKIRAQPVEWTHLRPPGACADFTHYQHGQPKKIYPYRDEQGLVGYVCRFEFPDGSKETLPLIYATNGKYTQWKYNGFTIRPLYNQDLIIANPHLPVVLCEGEKVADWLNERSGGKFIAATWVGGSNQVHKTDFSILDDRKVLICQDNDIPGKKCMTHVAENIQCEYVRWAEIPKGAAKGWDLADSEFDAVQVQNYVRRNLRAPVVKRHSMDETHFIYMGFEKSDNQPVFIFFCKLSKTIFRFTAASMTKSNLMCMAPLGWWEMHYGAGFKPEGVVQAVNALITTSYRVGIYSPKNVRGRGAWFDDGRVVIHAGDKLIVDGEEIELGDLDTNYIYEIGESFNFNTDNPLPVAQSKKLLEICGLLNWERGVNGVLLPGWCVIAPVCGALKWRPHIWITGGAGVGKSFAQTYIVRALLAETCLDVQGATTEAGLRQSLGFDAMPVVFDEVDANTPKAAARVEETIELARSASADDTGRIVKGSASHTAKSFLIRSCFAFSSILIGADKGSDRRRITTLALVAHPNKTDEERKQKQARYEKLKKQRHEVINDRFVAGLHARTIAMLPIILENAKTFTSAVVEHLGVQAMGDQLGPMLAGAYSLQADGLITYAKAVEYVSKQDWSEETNNDALRDEIELLHNLLDWRVKVDGFGERTVAELIMIITAASSMEHLKGEEAAATIRRVGLRVMDNSLLVSNRNNEIVARLEKTKWNKNFHKVLMRLDGATADNQRIMAKSERCVRIPLELII